MKHQIIFEDTSQTLTFIPPSIPDGGVDYTIELLTVSLDNADRTIASGTATLDTANETVTAASGPSQADPTKLTVASTTGFTIGHTYYIITGDGALRENFELGGLKANTYFLTKHPLSRDYSSSSTAAGIEHTATFPDATAALEEYLKGEYPMRVVWEYTLNGVKHAVQDEIELVRFSTGDLDLAQCAKDMLDAWPTIDSRLEHKGVNGRLEAARFGARRIVTGLKAKEINPQTFLMGEQGRWCLMWSAFKHLAQFGMSPGNMTLLEFKEDTEREYAEAFNTMTVGYAGKDVVETDHDTDTALPKDQTQGPYRQIILSS